MPDSITFDFSHDVTFLFLFCASSNATLATLIISLLVYVCVLIPFLSPFSMGLIPLGSPKYIPPVNSLTIIMSNPDTISGFKLDASTSCLKQMAGLRLANNFSSFLNFKSALSGLFENSKLSHLGPPTAPKITESDSKAL